MKKLNLLTLVLAAFITGANAQGLYVNAGAGYGFCLAGDNMGTNVSDNSVEIVRSSFGRGFNTGAGVGYMFNRHIGAEVNFNYLFGARTVITDNSSNSNADDVQTFRGNMLRIIPGVKVTYGDAVRPYARVGLVLGVANQMIETNEENSGAPVFPVKTEVTEVYSGGLALGFAGAFGVDFMITDMIGIYAELGGIAQSYSPTRSRITQYEVNGADQLPGMTTIDKETEYSADYNPNEVNNNAAEPRQQLKFYSPFSSIGLNAGVHIAFGGGAE